jgi:hypothetical protein
VLLALNKGSTFINFTDKNPQSHYYGIRKRSSKGIYLSTKAEDYFIIDRVTFHFFKEDGRQRVVAKGPINEDLEVMVSKLE